MSNTQNTRTIEVPAPLYAALQVVADLEQRPVEQVVIPALQQLVGQLHDRLRGVVDQLEQAITDKPVSVEADRSAVDKPATSQPQKPAKKRAKKTCQIAGCDKGGTMSRKMCRMHYQRWQKGTLDRAPDGTPSPAKKADDKPSTNGHGTDPTRCTAKACTQRRIAADAQLCPQHTTVLRDMASSLRPRFGSEAGNEALARLQDGRTVAS